jgi:hypothetical protein
VEAEMKMGEARFKPSHRLTANNTRRSLLAYETAKRELTRWFERKILGEERSATGGHPTFFSVL